LNDAEEAVQLLEKQRASGDSSETTTIAIAQAYASKAQILDNQNSPKAHGLLQRAAQLLQPLAESPGASEAVRRTYVEVLVRVGFELTATIDNKDAIPTEQKAMSIARAWEPSTSPTSRWARSTRKGRMARHCPGQRRA